MRRRDDGPDNEQELIRGLYETHGPVLEGFVRRFVDPGRAEDVVQEVMLRAWRNADTLDLARGDIRPYLFAVARNLLIDQWRAEQARPRLVSSDSATREVPVEDDVDRVLESTLIDQALQTLSPEHRAVVHQLFFLGRSVNEAAAVLRVPPGTVKSRSYYAVRGLRAAFQQMGVTR